MASAGEGVCVACGEHRWERLAEDRLTLSTVSSSGLAVVAILAADRADEPLARISVCRSPSPAEALPVGTARFVGGAADAHMHATTPKLGPDRAHLCNARRARPLGWCAQA